MEQTVLYLSLAVFIIRSLIVSYSVWQYYKPHDFPVALLCCSLVFCEILNYLYPKLNLLMMISYIFLVIAYGSTKKGTNRRENLLVALFANGIARFSYYFVYFVGILVIPEDMLTVLGVTMTGLASFVILTVCLQAVVSRKDKFEFIEMRSSNAFLLVVGLFSLVTILLEDMLNESYVQDPKVMFVLVGVLLMGLLSIVLLAKEKQLSKQETQDEYRMVQMEHMRKHMEDFEASNQKLSMMKHDLKNTYTIVYGYLQAGETESAKKILEDSLHQIDTVSVVPVTNSTPIDYILSKKQKEANEKSIDFVYHIDLSALKNTDCFDVAMVLANALDNALENVTGNNPQIVVTIREKNEKICMEVENTVTEDVLQKNPTLQSTKKSPGHGFGMESMRSLAAKHDGDLLVEVKNNRFVVLVWFSV